MTKEKKWIRVHRWFWSIACLICIVVSLTAGILGGRVAIVKDSAYAEGITCKIKVEFDKEVDQGFLDVAFYDAAGNLLDIQKSNLSVYGKAGSAIFFVNDADTYEILTCRVLPSGMILRIWLSVFFSIVFLTGSFRTRTISYFYKKQAVSSQPVFFTEGGRI